MSWPGHVMPLLFFVLRHQESFKQRHGMFIHNSERPLTTRGGYPPLDSRRRVWLVLHVYITQTHSRQRYAI